MEALFASIAPTVFLSFYRCSKVIFLRPMSAAVESLGFFT